MLVRFIVLLCAVMLLQACASTQQGYQLAEGKRNFNAGNYTEAFHELLPLAAASNPHAEYAVGYMYYYGYGVAVDTESGMFWMQKAAGQGYKPAQQALDLIRRQKSLGSAGFY